jgi:hypothetical protein
LIKGDPDLKNFEHLDMDREAFPDDWWSIAKRVADGKSVDTPIPQIKNVTETDKQVVLISLLPAYRVLKENFDHRHWYEWIFNHSQYTAERDSLKALSGLITSLTGMTKDDLDDAVEAHKNKVSTSGVSAEYRREKLREIKEERIYDIQLARAKKWDAEYKAKYGRPDDSKSKSVSELDSKVLDDLLGIPRYDDVFTPKVKNFLANEYNFADGYFGAEIENAGSLESEFNADKESVIFDHNEFAEFDNSMEIQEVIDEKNDSFIEKDEELIEEMNAIGL